MLTKLLLNKCYLLSDTFMKDLEGVPFEDKEQVVEFTYGVQALLEQIEVKCEARFQKSRKPMSNG